MNELSEIPLATERAYEALTEHINKTLSPFVTDVHSDFEVLDKVKSELERLREALERSQIEKHGASGMCCQLRESEKRRADTAGKERDELRARLEVAKEALGRLAPSVAQFWWDEGRIFCESCKQSGNTLDNIVHLRVCKWGQRAIALSQLNGESELNRR